MANLTGENNKRLGGLQQCKDKFAGKAKNHRTKEKQCLAHARETQKIRGELNQKCPAKGELPRSLKEDVDHCMQKGGASNVRIENMVRSGKVASCGVEEKQAKLKLTKKFPHSGKKAVRTRKWLPVDVCLRKYYKDNSWVFGLGGGITDVPPSWGCGKSVADAFCITKGYLHAIKHPVKTYDRGSNMDGDLPSTYWIGSKKACTGKCAGFSSITCKGKR